LNVLSEEEERFHFGMWAINKSPLVIGAALDKISGESLAILGNEEVIAINQDPLGKQARLVRRYTEEEWDIWAGELSGGRMVLALANWKNGKSCATVDLAILGISSAAVRDVWARTDVGTVRGVYRKTLKGHQLHIVVLSDIVKTNEPQSADYYTAADATLSGNATRVPCSEGQCLPAQVKVSIGQVAFSNVSASNGKHLLGVDFINYDVALGSAWSGGTNTRNMTIAVNGKAKRWAFPISGGNWFETGRLMVEVDGFKTGDGNQVVFGSFGNGSAPDLVGFEVFSG
jgi:alpha-galactosidase